MYSNIPTSELITIITNIANNNIIHDDIIK
jgi:hypothetical protein